jgi:hypothetical protein
MEGDSNERGLFENPNIASERKTLFGGLWILCQKKSIFYL